MRLPGIKEEAEEVTRQKGYYIHPYEWSDMLKMASRISATTMTYKRALIVLDLVSMSIKEMIAEREAES